MHNNRLVFSLCAHTESGMANQVKCLHRAPVPSTPLGVVSTAVPSEKCPSAVNRIETHLRKKHMHYISSM